MTGRLSGVRSMVMVSLIIAILVLPLIAAGCDSANPSGDEAPDFTLPTLTGANVTLSELEETPVVVNFWSISCYWCRQQLPYLESVAQQTEGKLEVIAINVVDSAASVQEFFGEYEPAMIIALDGNATTFVSYCQSFDNSRGSIPFTLFVDSEGMVRHKRIGAFPSEEELWNTLHDVFGIAIP